MNKVKNNKLSLVLMLMVLILLIQVDIINIFSPNKYLQKYGGYYSGFMSKQKVSFALTMGANPNLKIDNDPQGENPFFVSYVLENSDLVKLMLPLMECNNLEQVVKHEKNIEIIR